MPILFYSYLATQILAPFFASLAILSSVLFLSNLLPRLNIFIAYGIQLGDFIRLNAYLAPQLLLFSIPMASMMGVVLGITRLTNDREIMVFKACGTGIYKMLPPVIIIALCTAGLTGVFSTRLIPQGTIAMQQLLLQLAKEKIDRGLNEKTFSTGLGDIVAYADQIDPRSREWRGVYISDTRSPETPVTIMAKRGNLTTQLDTMILTISLTDGSLHRARGDMSQTMQFKQYTLRLPIPVPQETTAVKIGKNSMFQQQLLTEAAKQGVDSKAGADLLREYHKRLILPVSCFIFSLLGLPLGLLAGPGQRALGIPLGLGVFTFYYILLTAAEAMAEGLVMPVAVAMWLPNVIFTILTLYLIRSANRESSAMHLERLRNWGFMLTCHLKRLTGDKRNAR